MAVEVGTVWATTIALVLAALAVPYIDAAVKHKYFSPKLNSKFKLGHLIVI